MSTAAPLTVGDGSSGGRILEIVRPETIVPAAVRDGGVVSGASPNRVARPVPLPHVTQPSSRQTTLPSVAASWEQTSGQDSERRQTRTTNRYLGRAGRRVFSCSTQRGRPHDWLANTLIRRSLPSRWIREAPSRRNTLETGRVDERDRKRPRGAFRPISCGARDADDATSRADLDRGERGCCTEAEDHASAVHDPVATAARHRGDADDRAEVLARRHRALGGSVPERVDVPATGDEPESAGARIRRDADDLA